MQNCVKSYISTIVNNTMNDEMYYSNSNLKLNLKKKVKLNSLQHTNVDRPTAPSAHSTSTTPSALSEREPLVHNVLGFENQCKSGEPKEPKFGHRRISVHDHYTEINLQVAKIRDEGRYLRARVYLSIKDKDDKKYSIFLAGATTNCWTELYRGAKGNDQVLNVIETFKNCFGKDCLVGRLHYKAPKKVTVTDFHRKLLKHAIICLYPIDDTNFGAQFYLLGQYYDIELHKPGTLKQEQFYALSGMYKEELLQFDDEDELEILDETDL